MSSNSFGQLFRFTSFGESHGPAVGVVVDGCPSGVPFDLDRLRSDLARRRPGQSRVTTSRVESDEPRVLSGVFEGRTTGAPIAVIVENRNQRSEDYEALRDNPRPGHADETYAAKYGHRDHRGGGRSSGRETIARVIAGSIARQVLPKTCRIIGHAKRVGPVEAQSFDAAAIETNPVRCADRDAATAMESHILALKKAGDSVGGLVEILIFDPPAGLGEPTFGKLKARLADAVMSVGAVTGFSYGAGFDTATMNGLDYVADRNAFGGILGGISTGETIRLTASIKPTSSVADVAKRGRHDPCIVPRVIPVLEAMVAATLADLFMLARAKQAPQDRGE